LHTKNPHDSGVDAGLRPYRSAGAGEEKKFGGFFCRRSCLVPTLRCWIVFCLSVAILLTATIRGLHPFLALNDPVPDGLLVVEGWEPDYGMEKTIEEFKRNHHERVYVTGGPVEYGTYLTAYKTYAELGAATLMKLGLESNVVQAVPAPRVRQDRTYASAVVLKKWLLDHQIKPTRLQLISEGPHSRRSRMLFQAAMGKDVRVGVISIPSREYDQQHWWRYSSGVRNVIGEGLAYLYARLLFAPPKSDG
jgi:uncharacterized SAM-binding protein YcdF (DUF218 family)